MEMKPGTNRRDAEDAENENKEDNGICHPFFPLCFLFVSAVQSFSL
jgi:hypothetical protein